MMTEPCEPLLVADIGGTNARFALVTGRDSAGVYQLEHRCICNSSDFDTLEAALQHYFDNLNNPAPRLACLAVAGPVNSDTISLTNVNWQFSRNALQEQFGFARLEVLNDFAALACAAPCLSENELAVIKPGRAEPQAVKAIVGPGTGFGVAALAWTGERWQALPGEGGHAGFAPATELEIDILRLLSAGGRHVSRETLLCGRGLVTLYQTLAAIRRQAVRFDSPERITAAGTAEHPDPLCKETLQVFAGMLASAAGDIALTLGARGGVYVGGGIASQIQGFLERSTFENRLCDKSPMNDYLAEIPVYLLRPEQPALMGAAAWFDPPRSSERIVKLKVDTGHG